MKIRKLEKDDLLLRVSWMNRPEIYKNMHFTPPITLDDTKQWYDRNRSLKNRYDFAFEDDNGQIIAMGGITGIDSSVSKGEFYVFVNPDLLKRGIGTKATEMLCEYGFEVLNLHKIYLYTNENNYGARKTYEKIGFKLEGELRDELLVGDKYFKRLYYGLLAKEFSNQNSLEIKGWRGHLIFESENETFSNH